MTDAIIVPENYRWMRTAAAIARDQLYHDDGTSRFYELKSLMAAITWHFHFEKYGALLDPRVVFSNWTPTHSIVIVDEWPDNIIPFPMGRNV